MKNAISFLTLAFVAVSNAKPYCPIYGPLFPSPSGMRDHPRTKAAVDELNAYFADRIDGHGDDFLFSYGFEAFSTKEGELWSRYRSPPSFLTMNTTGVTMVDGNTVHRVGSITKLFAVYTFLATIGESVAKDPITKYIPELREAAEQSKKIHSSIFAPDWNDITVDSLMTYYSGLSRDYSLFGELVEEINDTETLYSWGLPPLSQKEIPPCGKNILCTRQQFLAGVSQQMPYYASYRTPVYNNIIFTLLSFVAESITGKPFMPMIEDTIIKPLNLTHTFNYAPNDSLGIFPNGRVDSLWPNDMGIEAPSGNMYSSVADLAKLGRAIMNSTLLKPSLTRQWLKPVSFLPDPAFAVGMPWEIHQLVLDKNTPYQYVTSFNKGGNIGCYATLLSILPDLDMGWSIASAGSITQDLIASFADAISDKFMALWLDVAREEAQIAYGGTYVHPTQPSNITINTQPDAPGLGIVEWIGNGKDMKMLGLSFNVNTTEDGDRKVQPSVRLYPTGLEDELPDGGKQVSFRAVFEDLSSEKLGPSYTTDCKSWIFTSALYGSVPFDILVFTLDKSGRAVSVESPALRVRMKRTG